MSDPIAVIKDVSYQYPQSTDFVLSEINLEVRKGEFLGLIGPTGAGKSTLCLALNGIVPQFYGGRFFGSVTVAGLDTLEHPISKLAYHVGQVFEDPETQLISTSVENEIAFALENLNIPREEIIARIPKVLESVRLEGTQQKHPHELSGGQKQRLAIAAAIAVRPGLLIFDEPTSQLDPIGTEEVFQTAYELNHELGMTIVMASHSAEEMAVYTDRVALLSHGKIVELGSPDEIYSDIENLLANELRPPQVARTFYHIQQQGIQTPPIPVRLEEGVSSLKAVNQAHRFRGIKLKAPPRQAGEPLLLVRDLQYVYPDGTKALDGINLEIRKGEYVLIIGQNGAGKSTLVKHFLKLLEPTRGIVSVSGVPTDQLDVSALARQIGYVAQNPDNQIFTSTVEDEVSFALKNLDYPEDEVAARTEESLRAMGLETVRKSHPLSLPKGDRARLVIAAILAMQPEIIIFDEPTTGQDYQGARYILDISRELSEMGKTVIVITHHLYLMPDYADRVVVMGKGTVLLDNDIRTAYHQTDLLRSTFLSPPQAVKLAQGLQAVEPSYPPLLTPEEIALTFKPDVIGIGP